MLFDSLTPSMRFPVVLRENPQVAALRGSHHPMPAPLPAADSIADHSGRVVAPAPAGESASAGATPPSVFCYALTVTSHVTIGWPGIGLETRSRHAASSITRKSPATVSRSSAAGLAFWAPL